MNNNRKLRLVNALLWIMSTLFILGGSSEILIGTGWNVAVGVIKLLASLTINPLTTKYITNRTPEMKKQHLWLASGTLAITVILGGIMLNPLPSDSVDEAVTVKTEDVKSEKQDYDTQLASVDTPKSTDTTVVKSPLNRSKLTLLEQVSLHKGMVNTDAMVEDAVVVSTPSSQPVNVAEKIPTDNKVVAKNTKKSVEAPVVATAPKPVKKNPVPVEKITNQDQIDYIVPGSPEDIAYELEMQEAEKRDAEWIAKREKTTEFGEPEPTEQEMLERQEWENANSVDQEQ